MPDRLQGKIAIVTGGGRGLGKAIAQAYAGEGAKVIVTASKNKNEIDETALKINGKAILADITYCVV
jgi:NAD(P)-dependent dehydrogenase (short-subunit alcohol dehydrogenase family)